MLEETSSNHHSPHNSSEEVEDISKVLPVQSISEHSKSAISSKNTDPGTPTSPAKTSKATAEIPERAKIVSKSVSATVSASTLTPTPASTSATTSAPAPTSIASDAVVGTQQNKTSTCPDLQDDITSEQSRAYVLATMPAHRKYRHRTRQVYLWIATVLAFYGLVISIASLLSSSWLEVEQVPFSDKQPTQIVLLSLSVASGIAATLCLIARFENLIIATPKFKLFAVASMPVQATLNYLACSLYAASVSPELWKQYPTMQLGSAYEFCLYACNYYLVAFVLFLLHESLEYLERRRFLRLSESLKVAESSRNIVIDASADCRTSSATPVAESHSTQTSAQKLYAAYIDHAQWLYMQRDLLTRQQRKTVYALMTFLSILYGSACFYANVEDWSVSAALTFTIGTFATIGWGSKQAPAPHTTLGKVMTVVLFPLGAISITYTVTALWVTVLSRLENHLVAAGELINIALLKLGLDLSGVTEDWRNSKKRHRQRLMRELAEHHLNYGHDQNLLSNDQTMNNSFHGTISDENPFMPSENSLRVRQIPPMPVMNPESDSELAKQAVTLAIVTGRLSAAQRRRLSAPGRLILAFGFVLIVMLTCSAAFAAFEGWSYGIALWFSFISASTIGYGDYMIETQASSFLLFWFLIFALGALTYALTTFAELLTSRASLIEPEDQQEQHRRLQIALDDLSSTAAELDDSLERFAKQFKTAKKHAELRGDHPDRNGLQLKAQTLDALTSSLVSALHANDIHKKSLQRMCAEQKHFGDLLEHVSHTTVHTTDETSSSVFPEDAPAQPEICRDVTDEHFKPLQDE